MSVLAVLVIVAAIAYFFGGLFAIVGINAFGLGLTSRKRGLLAIPISLVMFLVGMSLEASSSSTPSASDKPSVSPAKSDGESQANRGRRYPQTNRDEQFLTTEGLLAHFPGADVSGTTVLTVRVTDTAYLTVFPDGEYVKWAEVELLVGGKHVEGLSDADLAPMVTLLSTVAPNDPLDVQWLREAYANLPPAPQGLKPQIGVFNAWTLRAAQSKDGPVLTASQNRELPNATSTRSTPTPTPALLSPSDFENLLVSTLKPLVVRASVQDDSGRAVSILDAEFLLITVSDDWYDLTAGDHSKVANTLLGTFRDWSGNPDAILIISDRVGTKVADGNKFGVSVRK